MPMEEKRFRIDFVQEVTKFDEKNGIFEAILIPNPERYELQRVNGEEVYFDKFDETYIPSSLILKMLKGMEGMPIYYSPPKITNADEYVLSRTDEIRNSLSNGLSSFKFKDDSEDFLESMSEAKMKFAILSIDLKGSTKLSQAVSAEQNSRIISSFLREITLIVHNFGGYILKYVGDGVIAYFPEPNFIGMNDNSLDCAVTMKKLLSASFNPVMEEMGLPPLGFRIGIDSGDAMITILGAEGIKMSKDLIGETVNLASKIQALAKSGQILMGESTVLNLHTFWRGKVTKLQLSGTWNYVDKQSGLVYPVYGLNETW